MLSDDNAFAFPDFSSAVIGAMAPLVV
jgi:hypothetical protein